MLILQPCTDFVIHIRDCICWAGRKWWKYAKLQVILAVIGAVLAPIGYKAHLFAITQWPQLATEIGQPLHEIVMMFLWVVVPFVAILILGFAAALVVAPSQIHREQRDMGVQLSEVEVSPLKLQIAVQNGKNPQVRLTVRNQHSHEEVSDIQTSASYEVVGGDGDTQKKCAAVSELPLRRATDLFLRGDDEPDDYISLHAGRCEEFVVVQVQNANLFALHSHGAVAESLSFGHAIGWRQIPSGELEAGDQRFAVRITVSASGLPPVYKSFTMWMSEDGIGLEEDSDD